jgi:hypothetical protein
MAFLPILYLPMLWLFFFILPRNKLTILSLSSWFLFLGFGH